MSSALRRVLVPLDMPPAPVPGGAVYSLHGETMGTTWSVKVAAAQSLSLPDLQFLIQRALDDVVAQMSHWETHSDLGRFNRAGPGTWQVLPAAFYTVLDCALALARDSNGAYDPTIGALVNLWGFGPRSRATSGATSSATSTDNVPSDGAIRETLATCGWQRIVLDPEQRRALQPGGISLDFSSIAKGFGVDHVARTLEQAGIQSYLIEVGGELRGFGAKPDGSPWWVQLEQAPVEPSHDAPPIGSDIVALHGLSVATSGDYRRFFDAGGIRYAHTLDPRTGYPVRNAVASVTVLHPLCMVADALATLLTVLGPDDGAAYAERHGIAATIISRTASGLAEIHTPAFGELLT